MADTKTIAVCGKGGVGKTSISALMVRQLCRKNNLRVLAIDADPAFGLATSLGATVTKTVDDIRKDLIKSLKKTRLNPDDTLHMLDYEMFGALAETQGFALLAIGRPEDEGCFCKVNYLLKDIISDLADRFDIVLIDGEAGFEQINRRVMKRVDHLIVVSDTSAKGVNVAGTIGHLAKNNRAVDFKSIGLILNRVRDDSEVSEIRKRIPFDIYGWLTDDNQIRDYDFHARPLMQMPDDSPANRVIGDIMNAVGI